MITLDVSYVKPPEFKINTTIDFFGVREKTEVTFEQGIFEIALKQKIHGLFEADFLLAFGHDLGDQGIPSVYMAGQVSEGFDSWVLKEVPIKMGDFFSVLNNGYSEAVNKIKSAEAEVSSLKRKIGAQTRDQKKRTMQPSAEVSAKRSRQATKK